MCVSICVVEYEFSVEIVASRSCHGSDQMQRGLEMCSKKEGNASSSQPQERGKLSCLLRTDVMVLVSVY